MSAARLLAWLLFGLYATWAAALQGALAVPLGLGEWTPDLGLGLLFAWASRLRAGRGEVAAVVVALARASAGADPPLLLVAGSVGALAFFAGLRRRLEIDRPWPRALVCGACAFATAALLRGGRALVLAGEVPPVPLEHVRLWPGALATALACLVLAPLLARLPGLAPLAKGRS